MTEQASTLLRTALRLSVAERAELAAELLASLDGESDADVDAAWAIEMLQTRLWGMPVPGVDLPVRRVFMKRFPDSVIFMPLANEIVVLAFAHMKREPGYWLTRVSE